MNHVFKRRDFIINLTRASLGILVFPGLDFSGNQEDLSWHNPEEWGIEGKGWSDTIRYYDRLPAKAQNIVLEPVWNLSRDSSGMMVRFRTNSPVISVRYRLWSENLAMSHMPATGVSGLDLYAEDSFGNSRWIQVTRPETVDVEAEMAKDMSVGDRLFSVYLPLYNGIEKLEIGVLPDSDFTPIPPRENPPIVFYGTSIMQGACASRPGMSISAILGRRLHMPVINLGFSGNGRMELEIAELLSELQTGVLAIDCLPNMDEEMISNRAIPFVRRFRQSQPDTPVLLVEDRINTNSRFFPDVAEHHRKNRDALKKAFTELKQGGIDELYYLSGQTLLGEDGEAATDGSHPSDLGMVRYSDAYEPILKRILNIF